MTSRRCRSDRPHPLAAPATAHIQRGADARVARNASSYRAQVQARDPGPGRDRVQARGRIQARDPGPGPSRTRTWSQALARASYSLGRMEVDRRTRRVHTTAGRPALLAMPGRGHISPHHPGHPVDRPPRTSELPSIYLEPRRSRPQAILHLMILILPISVIAL